MVSGGVLNDVNPEEGLRDREFCGGAEDKLVNGRGQ